eukprot:14078096-Heterocapsa_arctica.AAC.1
MDVVLELNRHRPDIGDKNVLTVYTDANWASGTSRRSTTGGCIFYRNVLIATWSRTQPVVAPSSAESELLARTTAVQEGQFVKHVLDELGQATSLK